MNLIARIFMLLLGLTVVMGMLFAFALYIIFATVRWLLTGRKPQLLMVWQMARELRKTGRWSRQRDPIADASPQPNTQGVGDIIDIEAREVASDNTSHNRQ